MSYNYWCENKFICKHDCDICNSKGNLVLDERSEHLHCFVNPNIELKLMGENLNVQVGETLKFRPKAEARKRSLDNFKKEIYPKLPKGDRTYFGKKNKWKI